jgi:hypothetical protein
MSLEPDPALESHKRTIVDLYQFRSAPTDWKLIFNYPDTISLANRFGYDLDKLLTLPLTRRYFNTRPIQGFLHNATQHGRAVWEQLKGLL